MANEVDLDYSKLYIGPIIYGSLLAIFITLIVCSCVKKCPLYKYAHFGDRRLRMEDSRVAGLHPTPSNNP